MKLYTLISIALGVFGGTYSALAALRTHFETLIKEARQKADSYLQKISEYYGGESKTTASARRRKGGINVSSMIWHWCNTLPAILFSIFVFFIAGWVLTEWDSICAQKDGDVVDRSRFPWTWFHRGLFYLVVVDLFCLIGAAVAWCVCKFTSKVLREQYDTVLEEESKKISPLPKS